MFGLQIHSTLRYAATLNHPDLTNGASTDATE